MSLGRVRLVLWALVAVVAIGVAVLALRSAGAPSGAVESEPLGPMGGPFTLTGTDGKPFASQALNGKPRALFFGFTHCPDVCPNTLARLAKLRRDLGKGDDAFEIVLISVDPERDTPAVMKEYAKLFDTPVTALTGTPAQVETVKKQFGIFSEKVPQPNGDYTVDHSSAVLLFDRNDDFIGTITPEEGQEAALGKVKRLTS